MGSFQHSDTTRVITKRLVLSGHPFKVHKKTATVRYMFFNNGTLSVQDLVCRFDMVEQMTFCISNLSNYTRSTGELVISKNRWVPTDTSRPTSMALSTKWTRCACLYTNASIRDGRSCTKKREALCLLLRMLWRNDLHPLYPYLYTVGTVLS